MKRVLTILCLFSVVVCGATAQGEGVFMTFDEPGFSFFPGVAWLNQDGTAMCGAFFDYFYWTEDGGFDFFDTEGLLNGMNRISEDGMTIAVNIDNAEGVDQAAIWNAVNGFSLMDLVPGAEPCGNISTAYDVNFDASIGVGLVWIPSCQARAFKWTAGMGAVDLGSSGSSSRATGVSADGSTTVGFDQHPDSGYRRPAIWTDDIVGPQLIAGEETQGECYDATSDGSAVCGTMIFEGAFVQTGFYWDADVGAVDIGFLPGDENDGSLVFDMADDGTIVGYSGNAFFGSPRAIIWTPENGLMALTDWIAMNGITGYEDQPLFSASSISADGSTIVGAYVRDGFPPYGLYMIKTNGVVSNEDIDAEEIAEPDNTPQVATSLLGAHPNPFNPRTTIKFSLERDQQVRVSVFDLDGARVAVLADGVYAAGTHPVEWNGRDMAGRAVASGTYLIHMETEEGLQTSKMMLVR